MLMSSVAFVVKGEKWKVKMKSGHHLLCRCLPRRLSSEITMRLTPTCNPQSASRNRCHNKFRCSTCDETASALIMCYKEMFASIEAVGCLTVAHPEPLKLGPVSIADTSAPTRSMPVQSDSSRGRDQSSRAAKCHRSNAFGSRDGHCPLPVTVVFSLISSRAVEVFRWSAFSVKLPVCIIENWTHSLLRCGNFLQTSWTRGPLLYRFCNANSFRDSITDDVAISINRPCNKNVL